jgi:hypothetical protein
MLSGLKPKLHRFCTRSDAGAVFTKRAVLEKAAVSLAGNQNCTISAPKQGGCKNAFVAAQRFDTVTP